MIARGPDRRQHRRRRADFWRRPIVVGVAAPLLATFLTNAGQYVLNDLGVAAQHHYWQRYVAGEWNKELRLRALCGK